MRSPYRKVLLQSLSIAAAVAVYGVSYGVLAEQSGLSIAEVCGLSLFVFGGSSQFAFIGVVDAGGTVVSAVVSGLLLNARSAAYGLAMAPVLRGPLWRRLVASQLVIDESTAMATAQPDHDRARYAFWATGISLFVLWNLGSLVGALAGDAVGDPEALGLDALLPAAFVALLAPRLRDRPGLLAAAVGAAVALVLVPVTPAGVPIVAAAAGAVAALVTDRRVAVHP